MFTAPRGRILVIGDIMLDKYTETSVGRISPEAPVIVARVHGRWTAPGGAANVARNLATLGCAVSLIGVCGEDAAGRELGELLEKQAIRAELVRAGDRPTTCKTRVMARGQHLLRLDEEIGAPVQKAVLGRLREAIDGALPDAAAVILSDYGKGVLSHDAADSDALPRHVIDQCRKKGIAVLVDPKGDHWERYAGADCITPNTKELAHVLRADPEDM
nr:D-glycero-beta-D-manno-heptose 1-phosphate adenylyltransferase [Desulfovibrio sp.]